MSTGLSIRKSFDYDSLDITDVVFVQQQTGAIQLLMKRSAEEIVEIGQRLVEVKKRLGHGRFGAWLEAEFDWTERTARQFMRVSEVFKSEKFSDLKFAPSALYLLAAPSTPESAKEEAITRAEAGEPITHKTAKEIKQKHSPLSKNEPEGKLQPDNLQDPQQPLRSRLTPLPVVQSPPQPTLISAAESAPTFAPAPESETFPNGSQAVPPSAPGILSTRQRAVELSRPKLEVLAIRPKESVGPVLEELEETVETAAPPDKPTPKFVQPGTWWQLGEEHLLYCGDPTSSRFQERLPDQVALSLAFPSDRGKWPHSPSNIIGSALAWFTRYEEDQDLQLVREAVERFLMISTEGGDSVVFSFLPDPKILLLAHELECRCFCAEPDPARCEAAITAWKKQGFRAEKVTGLRF